MALFLEDPIQNALKKTELPELMSSKIFVVTKNPKGFCRSYEMSKVLKWNIEKKIAKYNTIWIDIEHPSEDEVNAITKKFNLHPLTRHDILHSYSGEKLEVFEDRNYFFVTTREVHYTKGPRDLIADSIHFVVFANLVITFHPPEVHSIEKVLKQIRDRKESLPKYLRTSGDWTLYSILDSYLRTLHVFAEEIGVETDALDASVLLFGMDDQAELLRRIGIGRKRLNLLRSHVHSKRDALMALIARDYVLLTDETKLYLRDVYDSVVRVEERLQITKETLHNMHSTYLAKLHNEVAHFSNDINEVLKKMGAVATVFIPLSFLATLGGMNIKLPGTERPDLIWFFSILGCMTAGTLLAVVYFYKRGWI